MKFGLTAEELKFIEDTIARPLNALGLKVYCFGSRARGTHALYSDLDLMIEGPKDSKSQILKSQIEEILTNSNFPYKIDLVFFEDYALSYREGYLADRKLI